MLPVVLLTQLAGVIGPDSLPPALRFRLGPDAPAPSLALPVSDTVRRRIKAIEYGDGYNLRLKIHKFASFATVPLFAAEYLTGDRLFRDAESGTRSSGTARSLHRPIAVTIGGLFAVNTVTGVWNLWEGRKDPAGRTRRIIHSVLMLASDAGFLLTAAAAPDDDGEEEGGRSGSGRNRHRNLAIGSGSAALLGYLMMLVWKG